MFLVILNKILRIKSFRSFIYAVLLVNKPVMNIIIFQQVGVIVIQKITMTINISATVFIMLVEDRLNTQRLFKLFIKIYLLHTKATNKFMAFVFLIFYY